MSERRDAAQHAPDPNHPVWNIVDWFPPTEWGEQAWIGFQRDLCELLREFRGQWTAYHGDLRIGIAANPVELYDECQRRGFPQEECIICRIQPILADEAIGLGLCRIEYVD